MDGTFSLLPQTSGSDDADRFTSMSVTRNPSATIVDHHRARAVRPPTSLCVDDIAGARPRSLPPHARSSNFFGTQDVEGAQPKLLHRLVNYTPEVVEGSAPRATKFRTNRQTDPVAPGHYGLPPAPQPAGIALPYKRDLVLRNDDIAGSAPNAHLPWHTREHHTDVQDIAGTTSRPRTLAYQHDHVDANLDVRDINAFRTFRSQRRSDPQRPTFAVHGRVVSDEDPGMFVAPPKPAAQHPEFSLTTADIEGAQANEAKEPIVGGIKPANRRDYRVTNFIADIAGCSPGSKKKGLTTLRGTNPLERDYVMLDGRTLDVAELTLGKSWYNAASTILATQAGAASATMVIGKSALNNGTAPYMDYAKRILDPKDAELARLRGEAATLRRERDIMHLTHTLAETARSNRQGGEYIASGAAADAIAGAQQAAEAAAAASETSSRAANFVSSRENSYTLSASASLPRVPALAMPTRTSSSSGGGGGGGGGGNGGGQEGTVTFSHQEGGSVAAAGGLEDNGSAGSRRGSGAGGGGGGGVGAASGAATGGEGIVASLDTSIGGDSTLSGASSLSRDPFLGDPGESGRGRGWHRTKGVGGRGAGSGATHYAATLMRAPQTSSARGENNNGAPLLDPLLTLRASAAPQTVRDILGVLPATRPQQDLSNTSSRREASKGKFDRTLDAAAAAARGVPAALALPAAAASRTALAAHTAADRGALNFEMSRARDAGRALALEIAEVRALPSFKPGKKA